MAQDITDLSQFCITSPINGAATPATCSVFVFPATSVTAGSFLYIATESIHFANFFGFPPTYTNAVTTINGDDAVALFKGVEIVDLFGEEDSDGTGEPWNYFDGWAYRNTGSMMACSSFTISDWSFSGRKALDGETSSNTGAVMPFPTGSFSFVTHTATDLPTSAPIQSFSLISDVQQGTGKTSPLLGRTVTVKAVVVGNFQNENADTARNLGGFYIQEEYGIGGVDSLASAGVFVYEETNNYITDVNNVSDKVQVTGEVAEFSGPTQITAFLITVTHQRVPLPSPAAITFPIIPNDLEAFEGMRVVVSNDLAIVDMYQLARHNEIKLYAGARLYQYAQIHHLSDTRLHAHLDTTSVRSRQWSEGSEYGYWSPRGIRRLRHGHDASDGRYCIQLGRNPHLFSQTPGEFEAVRTEQTLSPKNPRPLAPPVTGGTVKMTSLNVLTFFMTIVQHGATAGPSGGSPCGASSQAELN